MPDAPLLQIDALRTVFRTRLGELPAVDGVSLTIDTGRTLCVVGESGCGKSVLALSILRLVPRPGRIAGGAIRFSGRDLTVLSEDEMRRIRGAEIAMIFQEPMTSLNPVYPVGFQIEEAVLAHRAVSRREAREIAIEALARVRIPDPKRRAKEYPYQLSGGMRQRVMIAMALVCRPKLLIADEPTTALDVTIQAQILDLLRELQAETGMAILLITHDLGVVAEMADEVAVMYAGRVVERGPATVIFSDAQHPYTLGLFGSLPRLDAEEDRLLAIEGTVPPPFSLPSGCRFHPRCAFAVSRCQTEAPSLQRFGERHVAACFRAPLEAMAA